MSNESDTPLLFADLGLSAPVMASVIEVGYESPSPIQAATIPLLLANRDVLGQAQTGTGKTAAFALPILSRIDIRQSAPQALVLAPTVNSRSRSPRPSRPMPRTSRASMSCRSTAARAMRRS